MTLKPTAKQTADKQSAKPDTAIAILDWQSLPQKEPQHALVAGVDLVVVRDGDQVSVLYGRCLHRGALLADGHIDGHNLICGVHNWDFRYDTGVSEYDNKERLEKFSCWVEEGQLWVDEAEIQAWFDDNPQPFNRDAYQGQYADTQIPLSPGPSISKNSRAMASAEPATTAPFQPWAFPARNCHSGKIFNLSRPN